MLIVSAVVAPAKNSRSVGVFTKRCQAGNEVKTDPEVIVIRGSREPFRVKHDDVMIIRRSKDAASIMLSPLWKGIFSFELLARLKILVTLA